MNQNSIVYRNEDGDNMTSQIQWRVIATSVTGDYHTVRQQECEDSYYPKDSIEFSDDTLVTAVADGLGSATHAAKGAQFAAEKAVTLLRARIQQSRSELIEPAVIKEVFAEVRNELIALADSQHTDVKEFACTLQLVALNASQIIGGHIGDGLVIGVRHHARISEGVVVDRLSELMQKMYDNETHSVVGSNFATSLHIIDVHQSAFDMYDGVMLMTDGTQSLCFVYETKQLLQPFFVELINWANQNHEVSVTEMNHQLSQFFLSDDVRRQTRDDITLVFARHHSR